LPHHGIENIEVAVVAAEVDSVAIDRRRGSDAAAGFDFPILFSGGEIDRVKEVVGAAEKNRVVGNRRR
jgi:hypothetical protein